jgi:ribosomal protein S18 acetylase RimI-like enzyme
MHKKWDSALMAADLAAVDTAAGAPPGLVVERVRDREGLARWLRAFAAGFGKPAAEARVWSDVYAGLDLGPDAPWQHYVGRLDGEPVASSSVLLGAGVAGVYNVTTLPAARGRGVGAAMTRAPLADAAARGYRVAALQASELGRPVYLRLGFEVCGVAEAYAWRPAP